MILGPDGKPATQVERRAIGFVERTLPVQENDTLNMPNHGGQHRGPWRERGGYGGGWGTQYQEPFAEDRS